MHNGPDNQRRGGQCHGWLLPAGERTNNDPTAPGPGGPAPHPTPPLALGPIDSAHRLNDALADADPADGGWLMLTIDRPPETNPDLDRPATSGVGLVVWPEVVGRSGRSAAELARWLEETSATSPKTSTEPTVAVRIEAAHAVGGFDETAVGLGLADLVTRLRAAGWSTVGLAAEPLTINDLEPGLDPRSRLRSEAMWHRRYSDADGFDRFRTTVTRAAAVVVARATTGRDRADTATMARQILADARRRWPQPRPDESQQGTGQRADWRFLLPTVGAHHLLIAGSATEANPRDRHFLETDRWAERVTVGPPTDWRPDDQADVVFIGRKASVATAIGHAATDATVIVELDRSPIGRFRRVRALRSAGYEVTEQFLVTPDLATAKRYVPLNTAAISWLLAQPPPVAGTRSGPARVAVGLVIHLVATVVSRLASMPYGPVMAGAGAQGLLVANRPGGHGPGELDQGGHGQSEDGPSRTATEPPVLMTSGHDEGSRAVLVTLGHDVTKMAPRPRYNGNTDAEARVIAAVRSRLEAGNDPEQAAAAVGLLPTVKPPVGAGNLRGARESYAGRWTATDLCNRAPASRETVLGQVLEAIDTFGLAATRQRPAWSADLYHTYLGDLFDRYRSEVGWRPVLGALESALSQRSEAMTGISIPLVQRHYDLGPWNVVYRDSGDAMTIIDWELAPPRAIGHDGLGGADQLYFLKYWLHIAMETHSVDDELSAFEFLTDPVQSGAPRSIAATAYRRSLARMAIDHRFVPLLATHLWLEAALYTSARRADNGSDPGSPARYLETLANRRFELLEFWR